MNVLAVDPGKITGFAHWDSAELHTGELERMHFLAYAQALMPRTPFEEPLTLVIERYTVTAATLKKTRQLDALKIIGALEYLAWRHDCAVHTQPTGVAGRVSVKQLKALGWNRPTKAGHANVAVRHLVQHMAAYHPAFAERLLDAAG